MKISQLTILLSFLSFFTCASLQAQTKEIWVTHPQVEEDLKEIANLTKTQDKWQAKKVFEISTEQDIHSFTPNASSLKVLLKARPLIAGPLSHQPWLGQAARSGLIPKVSQSDALILNQYQTRDHYWLSYDHAQTFEKEIISFLTGQGIKISAPTPWSENIKKVSTDLKKLFKERGIKRVVLAHNALEHFLITECGMEVVTLYTDDHHSEISANHLKKVFTWASQKEGLLFIYESGITWPAPLKTDQFAKIPTLHWAPIGVSPLKALLQELKKVSP